MYRNSITALKESRLTYELEAMPRIIEKYGKLFGGLKSKFIFD